MNIYSWWFVVIQSVEYQQQDARIKYIVLMNELINVLNAWDKIKKDVKQNFTKYTPNDT